MPPWRGLATTTTPGTGSWPRALAAWSAASELSEPGSVKVTERVNAWATLKVVSVPALRTGATLAMLTIAARCERRRCGRQACVTRTMPNTLTSKTRCHSATSLS